MERPGKAERIYRPRMTTQTKGDTNNQYLPKYPPSLLLPQPDKHRKQKHLRGTLTVAEANSPRLLTSNHVETGFSND